VPLSKREAARRNKEYQEQREAESREKEWHEESSPEPVSVPKPKIAQRQPPGAFSSMTTSVVDRITRNSIEKNSVNADVVDHSSVTGDVVHGSLYKKGDLSQGVSPTKVFDYVYTRSNRGGNSLLLFVLGIFGIAVVLSLYQHTKIRAALAVAKKFNDYSSSSRIPSFE
jgi:cbb3-type cytochrome oxidase subunit 3